MRTQTSSLKSKDLLGIDVEPGLAQQHVGEQAAAHADLAVDAPHRERNPFRLEGFTFEDGVQGVCFVRACY